MTNFSFSIIVSKRDPAGMNIQRFVPNAIVLDSDTISADHLEKKYDSDLFIFASRHQSSSGILSLSIHVPGNWGRAEFGGRDHQLCIAPASFVKEGYLLLNKYGSSLGCEITMEQTHHGPIMDKPCFFIEIGSSQAQWEDEKSGRIIAKVISELIQKQPKYKAAVMIGGTHYNHEANIINLKTEYAVGHVCAKHCLEYLTEDMIKQAIERTMEDVDLVILDWKGLGKHKQRIVQLLEKLNIKYERSKNL